MNINWEDWIEEEKENLNESELTNEKLTNFFEENYLNFEWYITFTNWFCDYVFVFHVIIYIIYLVGQKQKKVLIIRKS